MIALPFLLLALAAMPSAAHAARDDPGGFRLLSTVLVTHEDAGAAVITVERSNVVGAAQVRYLTEPMTALRYIDYWPVRGMVDFLPGQASATFRIPIVDHGLPGVPTTIKVALFGPSPIGLAAPSAAMLAVLNDDPVTIQRDVSNPLALLASPPGSDPLLGTTAFVDLQSQVALTAERIAGRQPRAAAQLKVIAEQPGVRRFGAWDGTDPDVAVSQYLKRAKAQEPGTVPEISTYDLVDGKLMHGRCGTRSDPAWRPAAYHRWIQSLAWGIGDYRAIVFLEMDSLITVGCLSHHGLQVRLAELRDAVDILSRLPRAVIYLDAGAGDAVSAVKTARMLRAAGVAKIQGFFVNSTHFDWTRKEIRYGERISRLTGGKHFVVNTAENGQGPLIPHDRAKDGNEVLCDPPGRGLGPKPTFDTGFARVDAFAWIADPGVSGGRCRRGAPPTGFFWEQLALSLVRHADFAVR